MPDFYSISLFPVLIGLGTDMQVMSRNPGLVINDIRPVITGNITDDPATG